MDYEIRELRADELRAEDENGAPIIRANITFNALSVWMSDFMDRFREKIAPTAFDATLDNESKEVLAFWNHNTDMPLGRRSTGTLGLSKTATLFKAEIRPPDTTWGRDAVTSIKRGDVDGLSFGFRVPPNGDTWEEDADGNLIRTLVAVELMEVSPTPMPAYPKSSAAVRSAIQRVWDQREKERALAAAHLADRQRRARLHREVIRRISV